MCVSERNGARLQDYIEDIFRADCPWHTLAHRQTDHIHRHTRVSQAWGEAHQIPSTCRSYNIFRHLWACWPSWNFLSSFSFRKDFHLLSYLRIKSAYTERALKYSIYRREGCKTELHCQKSLKELSVSMQSITLHLLSSLDFTPYTATWIIERSLHCQLLHLQLSRINIQLVFTINKMTRCMYADYFSQAGTGGNISIMLML